MAAVTLSAGEACGPDSVEVEEAGVPDQLILGNDDVEPTLHEGGAQLLDPAREIVHLDHHLLDLAPVLLRQAIQRVDLALFDVDLEQVDTVDALFTNDV